MESHWPRVRELVAVIVALLYGQDDNGMEIYFTSSMDPFGPFSEPKDFVRVINKMKPKAAPSPDEADETILDEANRADDIRKVLFHILGLVGKKGYKRKLTLIILTDGLWKGISDKRTVANGIVNCLEQWQDEKALREMLKVRGVSLQFVQFGKDEAARKEFTYMDDHLVNSKGRRLP